MTEISFWGIHPFKLETIVADILLITFKLKLLLVYVTNAQGLKKTTPPPDKMLKGSFHAATK